MSTASSPDDLLRISGSYWQASALQAGVMLDVFTVLGDGTKTAGELAAELGCDARALDMLLTALTAMGLLARSGHGYGQTESAKASLDARSPGYIGFAIRHHHRLVPAWAELPEAVRTGRPRRDRVHMAPDDGDREDFLMGMYNIALAIAPGLARTFPLPGRTRLLDLGGGPGTYAAYFCLANPGLTATIYDLASSRQFAQGVCRRLGVEDRVDFVEGDYLRDPVPGGFDVAWLSQIFHAESPEGCRTILGKAVGALKPGGLVCVHEFLLDDTMDGPEFASLFSLNMLLGTPHGQAYAVAQIREMFAQAGLTDIRLLDFRGPSDSRILCGVVPG
jgi:SAM-dependent methyltransferase